MKAPSTAPWAVVFSSKNGLEGLFPDICPRIRFSIDNFSLTALKLAQRRSLTMTFHSTTNFGANNTTGFSTGRFYAYYAYFWFTKACGRELR